MTGPYDVLVDELCSLLKPGFGGSPRREFVAKIDELTRQIERESNQNRNVREKCGGVREWVSRACSTSRYKDWGLGRVEELAAEDAYRLKLIVR